MPFAFRLMAKSPLDAQGRENEEDEAGGSSGTDSARFSAYFLDPQTNQRISYILTQDMSHQILQVIGRGFDSSESATAGGSRAEGALRMAGVSLDVPIQFGDGTNSRVGTHLSKQYAAQGVLALPDRHGLLVWEETGLQELLLGATVTAQIVTEPQHFFNELYSAWCRNQETPSTDWELASDLYFLAEFETSMRAKVITLATALEVLSAPRQRDGLELHVLETAVAHARKTMKETPGVSFDSLIGGLLSLRQESIGSAISGLVESTLGAERLILGISAPRYAKRAYNVRSSLVHAGGSAVNDQTVGETYAGLKELVRAALLNISKKALDLGLDRG